MEKPIFTCKDCGSHSLKVVREFCLIEVYEQTMPCNCEEGEELAAYRRYRVIRQCRQWGWLDEGHKCSLNNWEEDEEFDEEEDDLEIYCYDCYESNQDFSEETDSDESETDEEYYIYCGGCEREIEFGWSHPARSGRIWPAECTDFNPLRCFPEKKYEDKWGEKGWLRPPRKKRIYHTDNSHPVCAWCTKTLKKNRKDYSVSARLIEYTNVKKRKEKFILLSIKEKSQFLPALVTASNPGAKQGLHRTFKVDIMFDACSPDCAKSLEKALNKEEDIMIFKKTS